MKKHLFLSLTGSLILTFILSCGQQSESESGNSSIPLAESFSRPSEIRTSDYFSKVRYIALETNEECLVGNIPRMMWIRDYIVMTSTQRECLLFDGKTGKFLRKIGHIGQDPEGYMEADCWADENTGLLYFKGWGSDLIVYDLEGNFIRKIMIPADENERQLPHYFHLGADTLIGYCWNFSGQQTTRLFYFTEEGERVFEYPVNPPAKPFDISNINVFRGNPAVESYGFAAAIGAVIAESATGEEASLMLRGGTYFWQQGEGKYFKEECNDTIFRLEDTMLVPHLIFDMGDFQWPQEKKYDKDQDKNIWISYLLDSPEYLFFEFITYIHTPDKRTVWLGAYNKKNGRLNVDRRVNGIKNDLNGFMPFHPFTVSPQGFFSAIIPAEDILIWEEDHPGEELPSALKALGTLQEDDNPVIAILEP